MLHGVDVSSYQPTDYSVSGQAFVFVKATEGTGYVNPLQSAQAQHARAAGCVVGFYHYLNSSASMQAQASYLVQQCDSQPGDILACDWEETSVSGADKDAFLAAVKALRPDHRLVLYCNLDFWRNRDTSSDCADGLWIADITTAGQPRVQHPWTFHQYDDSGIDRDVANFPSAAALRAWAAGATTPTPQEEDMPLWLEGEVTPGSRPRTVQPPCGDAWSKVQNRKLHLSYDEIGNPGAEVAVRVRLHDGHNWSTPAEADPKTGLVNVTAAGGRVDVAFAANVQKISLQIPAGTNGGAAWAVEAW